MFVLKLSDRQKKLNKQIEWCFTFQSFQQPINIKLNLRIEYSLTCSVIDGPLCNYHLVRKWLWVLIGKYKKQTIKEYLIFN